MTQQTEKRLHTIPSLVGVFLFAMLIAVGTKFLCHPNTWIDLLPQGWLSDEDRKVLKNPEAANKAAFEKMSREAWEHSQAK